MLSNNDTQQILQQALEQDQFRLYYQPIYCLQTRELVGLEALVRWVTSTGQWISPAKFIPLAEQTGLIVSLGEWILKEACYQLKEWHLSYPKHSLLSMSVNISGKQLQQPNFFESIDRILQDSQLEPECLNLELTESILVDQIEIAQRNLELLRAKKVVICLDDFGVAYSCLNHLHQLPIDKIKIDQCFAREMMSNWKSLAIVKSILYLSDLMGLKVVIEGLETDEQVELAKSLNCHFGQGYYLARPLSKVQTDSLLAAADTINNQDSSLVDYSPLVYSLVDPIGEACLTR